MSENQNLKSALLEVDDSLDNMSELLQSLERYMKSEKSKNVKNKVANELYGLSIDFGLNYMSMVCAHKLASQSGESNDEYQDNVATQLRKSAIKCERIAEKIHDIMSKHCPDFCSLYVKGSSIDVDE